MQATSDKQAKSKRNVSDRWAIVTGSRRAIRGERGGDCPPRLPLSIAPVESGAEVMIERDATTARSNAQLHLVTVVHSLHKYLLKLIFNLPFLSLNAILNNASSASRSGSPTEFITDYYEF